MKNKLFKSLFILLVYFQLLGCPSLSLNEGAVDYRYIQDNANHHFDARYFAPSELSNSGNNSESLLPIKENQSISISLKQVFICNFRESGLTDWDISSLFNPAVEQCNETGKFGEGGGTGTRGEILIVANVFERTGSNLIAFDPESMNKNGRVIFYSDDVRESGQYLNLSYLPIYGPVTYTGNPVYISFSIQELDTEENKQMQAVLSTLSNIGGNAYPPAAPVLGILNALGGAILVSDTDDIEFRYHAIFEPIGGSNVYIPALLPGDYAVIRKEKRLEPIDWSNLKINRKTGRLQRCIEGKKCIDYIESTYFTFSINTYQKTFAMDAAQSVSEFLQQNAEINAKNIDKFIGATKNIGASVEQIRDYDNIRSGLNDIALASDANEKKVKATDFAKQLCIAVENEQNATPETPSSLTNEQLNFIVNQLVERFQVPPAKVSRKNIQEKCGKNTEALVNDLGFG